ncbi:MAG: tRNA-specific 2-thiouridylase [Eubacterium sp.]|nr:tRNA-specific 2-thiouridylase [Eubacterium sp.]
MTKKIVLGFSGGADSTAAALLLRENHYVVTAVTLDFTGDAELLDMAARKAECLGIAHRVVDVRRSFEDRVVTPFIEAYRRGETPNPCLVCDTQVKLVALAEAADALGIDRIATGHYLRVEKGEEGIRVLKSPAVRKDQSYYFYRMPQAILRRLVVPLADFEDKAAVLAFLEEAGHPFVKGEESQGICFVNGDRGAFLRARLDLPQGVFVDTAGRILGSHDGFYHFTLGQFRGINLDQKYYVVGLDPVGNRVILGQEAELYKKRISLREVSFLDGGIPQGPLPVTFRICRWGYELRGIYLPLSKDSGYIEAEAAVRAPTPGQAAVFYRGDELLGGGTICGA